MFLGCSGTLLSGSSSVWSCENDCATERMIRRKNVRNDNFVAVQIKGVSGRARKGSFACERTIQVGKDEDTSNQL